MTPEVVIESGWLLIALAIPLVFDPGSAQPFEPVKVAVLRTIVIFMVVFWVLSTKSLKLYPTRHVALTLPPLLALTLALLYLAATVLSVSPRLSLWGSYQWRQGAYTFLCLLVLFALVAGQLRTRQQRERLVTTMLFASAVVSGYGLLQFAGLDPIPWERPAERPFATLGHPNFLGLYLAMTMPLAVVRLLEARAWSLRSLYAGLLFIQIGCLLATASRSAGLGALAASATLALLGGSRTRHTRWVIGSLVVVTVALLILAAWAYADPGGWASGGALEPIHSLLRGKSATTTIRILAWSATAQLIARHPLSGTGPESFALAFQAVYPPALTVYGGIRATGGQAHNEFLAWAVNAGLPGLVVYLALVVAVCWCGWRVVKNAARPEALTAAAFIAGVVAYQVANQFSFGVATTLSTLWLSLGVLAGAASAIYAHSPGGKEVGAQTASVRRRKLLSGAGLFLAALVLTWGTNVVPLLADAHVKTGLYHLRTGDWPAAIAAYERAIAWQPDQDYYQALLASAQLARAVNGTGAAFPLAEAASERAIARSPLDEEHWLMLGDVRRYWGQATADPTHLDRASAAYRQAQHLSPTDPEPLIKTGQVLMLQGYPAEAVLAYQAALALDPLNASAYSHLALAYQALGRPAEAAEALRQATRVAEECDRLISKR